MMGDKGSIKQSILDTLSATFSVNQQERSFAEEQLKVFETTEEYGVHLTEIIITVESPAPHHLRQLASVILKHYVETHWSQQSEKFTPPETTEQAKVIIRQTLPRGLQDESSKIRSSVAYALSNIAHWDWPQEWPGFFELLIQALHTGQPNIVHGAMRVLTEFAKEVSDLQLPHVAPVILPELFKILENTEVYSIRTRSRAVNIFSTFAGLLSWIKEVYKNAPKELLYPILPDFIKSFSRQLVTPDGLTSDWGHKKEILEALETLVKGFPRYMTEHIPVILPPVWRIFTESMDFYMNSVVNNIDSTEAPVDEDGDILSFENLVYSVFDFITALVETPKFKKTVRQYLEDILFYTMIYMQMTEEQSENWTNDPNQFVEDEDEESLSCSVRYAAQYLLLTETISGAFQTVSAVHEVLCRTFPDASAQCLVNAVTKVKAKGDEAKVQGNPHWWKFHEVCLVCLGCIKQDIMQKLENGQLKFDVNASLIGLMTNSCSFTESPFLVGQAIWCSSRYVSALSPEQLNSFLSASVVAVQDNQSPVLRVLAIKALWEFCIHLKETENVALLEPHMQQIASGLISLATQYTESALAITLDTLNIVLSVNAQFTATVAVDGNVVPLLNALFLKYGTDHHISPILEQMFGTLSSNEGCFKVLIEKTLPTLASIIEAPPDKVPQALVPPTIDNISTIVRSSPQPLPDVLVKRIFPGLCHCITRSEDNAVIQNGGECVRAFVSCAVDQLMAWHDGTGQNGIQYVIQVACHLLDPRLSEHSASFAGRLINVLISKIGANLGENLHLILRAVLSKLQQAEVFTVIQSLLMVFIQLIRFQLEMTLEFLSAVPSPTGKAALEYILTEWCNKQPAFFGAYDRKASCDALCKVLLHALNNGDQRFSEIKVPGDEIPSQGIQTRSKAKAAGDKQYTYIPVGVKMFKLILNELSVQIEKDEADKDNPDDDEDDDDDDDDDWEDVDDENVNTLKDLTAQSIIEALFSPASDYAGLLDFMPTDDGEEEDDDPDVKSDPINETNMRAYLTQFVQGLSQQAYFQDFVNCLNQSEKQCLSKVGIGT